MERERETTLYGGGWSITFRCERCIALQSTLEQVINSNC